jgi:1-acyl-sn-glycerol-3-phosphate acyltransferase
MKSPAKYLLSAWSWFTFGLLCAIWLPAVGITFLITRPFDRSRFLNPHWKFKISGVFPANPRNPYVVVCNHQSFVDMLLISQLPWEMKWMSKQSLFKVPVAGWMLRLAGDVEIRRGDARSALKALRLCQDKLEQKVSVMMFPEGTRSRSGELAEFKDGAFKLAIEAGVPILPMVLNGTYNALTPNSWTFNQVKAELRVLDPIDTSVYSRKEVSLLRQHVQGVIAGELAKMN